jgi:hypothetical protein
MVHAAIITKGFRGGTPARRILPIFTSGVEEYTPPGLTWIYISLTAIYTMPPENGAFTTLAGDMHDAY